MDLLPHLHARLLGWWLTATFLPITAVQFAWYWLRTVRVRQTWALSQRLGMHCVYQGYGSAYCYRGVAPVQLHFNWMHYRSLRRTCGQWAPLHQFIGPNVEGIAPGMVDLDVDARMAAPNPPIQVQVLNTFLDMLGRRSLHVLPYLTCGWGDGSPVTVHAGWLAWDVSLRFTRWPRISIHFWVWWNYIGTVANLWWFGYQLHIGDPLVGIALGMSFIALITCIALANHEDMHANEAAP